MEQTERQEIKLRHSKEDKKRSRKRRKARKRHAEEESTRPSKVSKLTAVAPPKAGPLSRQVTSRAHTLLRMAVSRKPRSTFTPNIRSALPPKGRDTVRHLKSRSVTLPPELNRSLLSHTSDREIVLGEGTYGVTRLMHYNGSSCLVAVKEFKRNDLYEVQKEAGVVLELQKNHHLNLPIVLGVCTKETPYLMISQFYGKGNKSFSLRRAVERQIIEFEQLVSVFKQIVHGLQYIHETGWLHNDLKENNVLMHVMANEWKPVIIDYGKSRQRKNPKRYNLTDKQKDFYRSKHPWIAPELVEGTHSQSPESDVYSLGVLFQSVLNMFVQRNVRIENLAEKCTAPKPHLRISLKELKEKFISISV